MPFADLQREILDQDMCARCGACVAICPPDWLTLDDGGTATTAVDPATMDCGTCSLCLDVCPGRDTATPQSEQRIFGRTRTTQERWTGIYRESLLLSSYEPRIKAGAAAGGAGSSLLVAALRSGLAEAVIVVGRESERPWVPTAIITDDEDVVLECAQTSYCLTPNLQRLRDQRFSRVAVVGVPCEIQAIGRMKNLSPMPDAAAKVVLTLEIACASSTLRAGTEHLITENLGVPLHEVAEMRYRDGEYPGQFAVTTHAGERRALPFHVLVDTFKKYKTHRCLTCGDWWSGLADVSISDGDPNIYATSLSGAKPPRQSIVMVRTQQGADIVDAAVELGLASVKPSDFVAEDNLGLQRKRFRYASFAQSMPERVPTPPVYYDEAETLLSDSEVIDRMTNHMSVATRRSAPGGMTRGPVRIAASSGVSGEVRWQPPGDKSISQRASIAAALADGTSTLRNVLRSDDTESNFTMLRRLGADIWEAADATVMIRGRGLKGLSAQSPGSVLDARNSATTARILIAILAGTPGEFVVDGNELLRGRPMEWIVDPLIKAGADITYEGERHRLPVRIRGGKLQGIHHQVGVFSAQPVSALLFAALQCQGPSVIGRLVRARDHTERLLRHLGVEIDDSERVVQLSPPRQLPPFELTIPGDISGSSFPIACVVASPTSQRLVIERVGVNETRIGFIRTLQQMGAKIEIQATGTEGGEPVGRVVVESGNVLHGIEIGGNELTQSMIDELPLLAALAARATGRTVIRDASELRDKDTDRIKTTAATLRAFGVQIEERADGFAIEESQVASPGMLALPPDHRVIFAAMTLASSLAEPTTLSGWERVSVSFPDCLDILGKLASVSRAEGG